MNTNPDEAISQGAEFAERVRHNQQQPGAELKPRPVIRQTAAQTYAEHARRVHGTATPIRSTQI